MPHPIRLGVLLVHRFPRCELAYYRYPAQDLQDCLFRVAGAPCYSSIDLKAGFHNVLIDHNSQKFTIIVT